MCFLDISTPTSQVQLKKTSTENELSGGLPPSSPNSSTDIAPHTVLPEHYFAAGSRLHWPSSTAYHPPPTPKPGFELVIFSFLMPLLVSFLFISIL